MKLKQILILTLSTLFAIACKKEEGPVGPQGPTGNANVQSQMITVLSSEWEDDGYLYSFTTPCSIITQEIAESGAVLCYLENNGIYRPIPFSVTFEGENTITHMGFEHMVNEIYFFFQTDDGMTPAPGNRNFKVVAIESSGLAANPGVDLHDYKEVKQAFGLTE